MKDNAELYCNCISGAITIHELKSILTKAGFTDIAICHRASRKQPYVFKDWVPGSDAENYVVSAKIKAVKPV